MTPNREMLLRRGISHAPVARTKPGYEYPGGVRNPSSEHTLTIFDCACGHRGSVWYASEDRARRSWERHLHA